MLQARVYKDIDGVLSPAGASPSVRHTPQPEATGWTGDWSSHSFPTHHFESVPADWDSFNICWSHELIQEVNAIDKMPNVEVMWSTVWRQLAKKLFAPQTGINSDHWRVLHSDWPRITAPTGLWWKHEQIMEDLYLNPVDRVLWVDDELPLHPEAIAWANTQPNIKLIIPTTAHGLTRTHINEMLDFLQ